MIRIFEKMYHNQSGNMIFALFGAVAFLGVLGVSTMTVVQGPLKSSKTVSNISVAESQMMMTSKIVTTDSAMAADQGDCDGDGFVEAAEYKAQADVNLKPAGGGNLPDTIGASKQDPWGSPYGYCVWNGGPYQLADGKDACDSDGSGTERRLNGPPDASDTVLAVISAGPDREFDTTCSAFVDANADNIPDTDLVAKPSDSDDIILSYTYREAAASGSGLWEIKPDDASTAEIDKNIDFSGGITIGTQASTSAADCDSLNDANKLYFDDISNTIVRCDGAGNWLPLASAPTLESEGYKFATNDGSSSCDPADVSNVRYNSATDEFEVCNGGAWRSFNDSDETVIFKFNPADSFDFEISGTSSPYRVVTVTNTGSANSATLSTDTSTYLTGPFAYKFEIDFGNSTCDNGIALQASEVNSCTLRVRGASDVPGSWGAYLNVSDGSANHKAFLHAETVNGNCVAGDTVAGGYAVADCTGPGGGPGDGQLVYQRAGCDPDPDNPSCHYNPAGDPSFALSNVDEYVSEASSNEGDINTSLIVSYLGSDSPAASYCNDLVLDGYDNWYLPSQAELDLVRNVNTSSLDYGKGGGWYWASNINPTNTFNQGLRCDIDSSGTNCDTSNTYDMTQTVDTRCMRKHNTAIPMPVADTNPEYPTDTLTLTKVLQETPDILEFSESFTVYGINQAVPFSISGDGDPAIRINNGRPVTTGTIKPRDEIIIQATSGTADRLIQLTIGTDESPVDWLISTSPDGWVDVSLADDHACGVQGDGTLWCWGSDQYERLGNGSGRLDSAVPILIDNGPWSGVYVGEATSCAIKAADQSAWCWGLENEGQTATYENHGGSNPEVPKDINSTDSWQKLSVGYYHGCGLNTAGDIYCWGRSDAWDATGVLGGGPTTQYVTDPEIIAEPGPWIDLDAGATANCAIKEEDGSAWCWGAQGYGILGDGSGSGSDVPVKVADDPGPFKSITVDDYHACAITTGNKVFCWGGGNQGKLGDGGAGPEVTPFSVAGGYDWIDVDVGNEHTCAIRNNNKAYCWGANNRGQLGNSGAGSSHDTPQAVTSTDDWIKIATGEEFSCGIKSDNTLWCWGRDELGKLGNGPVTGVQNTPQEVVEAD